MMQPCFQHKSLYIMRGRRNYRMDMPNLFVKSSSGVGKAALVVLSALLLSFPAFAQDQGPLPAALNRDDDAYNPAKAPVCQGRVIALPPPAQPATKPASPAQSSSGISKDQPSIPVDQIIQKFAE